MENLSSSRLNQMFTKDVQVEAFKIICYQFGILHTRAPLSSGWKNPASWLQDKSCIVVQLIFVGMEILQSIKTV
jgi:hypothetical protein